MKQSDEKSAVVDSDHREVGLMMANMRLVFDRAQAAGVTDDDAVAAFMAFSVTLCVRYGWTEDQALTKLRELFRDVLAKVSAS